MASVAAARARVPAARGAGGAPESPALDVPRLRRRLLAWFADHRRDLPWRRTRDPYAIWVSEVMLQQTRAEVVADYWPRFLERFPDVRALARAPEDAVLAAWSGLGYYRRARALRRAARAIVERHAGELPRTRAEWLALPGVGPYTAGAVLSIAFDLSEPALDGNALRVLARLTATRARADAGAARRALEELAGRLARTRGRGARAGPGALNQALMELGATLCTPRSPRCGDCPWTRECRARALGIASTIPRLAPRRAAVPVEIELLLAERGGRVLLWRRPAHAGARLAGLWELPGRELAPPGALHRGLMPEAIAGARFAVGATLADLAHTITHHRMAIRVRGARLIGGLARTARGQYGWFPRRALARAALGGMARKALRALGRL
jgi:A/G-specific adenine glycosylase